MPPSRRLEYLPPLLCSLFVHGLLLFFLLSPGSSGIPGSAPPDLECPIISLSLMDLGPGEPQSRSTAPANQFAASIPADTLSAKHVAPAQAAPTHDEQAVSLAPRPVHQVEKKTKAPVPQGKAATAPNKSAPSLKGLAIKAGGTKNHEAADSLLQGQGAQRGQEKSPGHGENSMPGAPGTVLPGYVFNPDPPYPELALRRGWQGTVLLLVRVLADGTAGDLALSRSSGYELLDAAALRAVRGWRFRPGTSNGLTEAMDILVPVHFQLQ